MLPTLLSFIFRVYDNGSRRVLEIRSEGSIPSTLTRIVRVSFKVGTIPEIPCVSISQWYVMKPEPDNNFLKDTYSNTLKRVVGSIPAFGVYQIRNMVLQRIHTPSYCILF